MQDIRKSLISNITNKSYDELWLIIEGASLSDDDSFLSSLGILFEIWWKNSSYQQKELLIHDLTKYLN